MTHTADLKSLELEVERAWLAMTPLMKRPREIFVTRAGRLVWGEKAIMVEGKASTGTFTHKIGLAAFREEVFFAFDQLVRGKA